MNTKTQISTKTVLNIKIDKKLKLDAQKIAHRMGINLSLVANAAIRNFVQNREIKISDGYTMTPYLENLVWEAQKDYDAGLSVGPFYTAEEVIKYLNS